MTQISTKLGLLQLAEYDGYVFTSACNDDVLLRTTQSNQKIMFGTTSNTLPALQIESNNVRIAATTTFMGNILPGANSVYDIGSSTQRFSKLFLAGSTIDLGGVVIDSTSNNDIYVGTVDRVALNASYRRPKLASPALALESINTWRTRTPAANNEWTSVAWSPELRLFVAVSRSGTTNRVMTSNNGIAWTIQTAASNNNWQSVIWIPQLGFFVALSSSGTNKQIMTSSGGITWTAQTTPVSNEWRGLAWSSELQIVVAVGATGFGNRIMTSTNLTTWTVRTSPANHNWQAVAWSPELMLFAAVANSGTGQRVMTSADGISWSLQTTPADNGWRSIAWSSELGIFVAVASSSTASLNRIMTSYDGKTWTLRTAPVALEWSSVTWAPELGLFIAVSESVSGNQSMASYNGIHWFTCPSPANNKWSSIVWAPELSVFVAVAAGATATDVMTSKTALPTAANTVVWPKPFLFAHIPATATITVNTSVGIPFNTVTFDTNAAYNTTTGIFTAQVAGYYRVTAFITHVNATTNSIILGILKSGSLLASATRETETTTSSIANKTVSTTAIVDLQVGDTIQIRNQTTIQIVAYGNVTIEYMDRI